MPASQPTEFYFFCWLRLNPTVAATYSIKFCKRSCSRSPWCGLLQPALSCWVSRSYSMSCRYRVGSRDPPCASRLSRIGSCLARLISLGRSLGLIRLSSSAHLDRVATRSMAAPSVCSRGGTAGRRTGGISHAAARAVCLRPRLRPRLCQHMRKSKTRCTRCRGPVSNKVNTIGFTALMRQCHALLEPAYWSCAKRITKDA